MRQRTAIQIKEAPGYAPLLTWFRASTRECNSCFVVERDAPFRVRGIDGCRQSLQQLLVAMLTLPNLRIILLAPSDIACDRELGDAPVRHLQRHRMGLHIPPGASEADDVELPAQLLPSANSSIR